MCYFLTYFIHCMKMSQRSNLITHKPRKGINKGFML